MKKYLSIFIALLLLFSVTACSGGTYTRKGVHVNADITDYAVISNGGSAVQYGEYIYFINGYRGYSDENGNENTMGKVIKGGLYRTTLIDPRQTGGSTQRNFTLADGDVSLNVFTPSIDPNSFMEFESKTSTVNVYQRDDEGEFVLDDDDEKIVIHEETVYNASAELIVPKTVGTAGYQNGGIFIYDELIFFASPNNNRNRENAVQFNKTDFYVSTLDGSRTRKLYTTNNDSSSSPYAFYKYAGNYYLVVQDGSDIVSVCLTSKGKIEKPKTIAENVSSVLFPTKDIYYNFVKDGKTYATFENTAEDFIYYTRSATKDDNITIGQVIEMLRPNGTQELVVSNDGGSVRLLNTNNGVLFYEASSVTTTNAIKYSNFHNTLSQNFEAYKNAHQNAGIEYADVSGTIALNASNFDSVRCFYPNPKNIGEVFVVTFGTAVNLHSASGSHTIFNGSASFVKLVENRLYILANEALQVIDFYEGGLPFVIASDASNAPTFMFDILDTYVVYFGNEDDLLSDCAKFKQLNDEGFESLFIGERTEAETPSDD